MNTRATKNLAESPKSSSSKSDIRTPRPHRTAKKPSATRDLILEVGEKIMLEEGYAAVTTRRVAERAGFKSPLVHYYFKTTDDLLINIYRRGAKANLQRHSDAMTRGDLLDALWEVNADPERTALGLEFMALANHRKFIRDEMAQFAEQIRAVQIIALEHFLRKHCDGPPPITPASLTVVLAAIARTLVMENGVGITLGHDECRETVMRILRSFAGVA